jgi:primosomal protein N' (replication factor Y)
VTVCVKEQYADVIVDITAGRLDRVFQYRIPEEFRGKITPGMCVDIPFGRSDRAERGYVIALSDHAEVEPDRIKEISGISEKGVTAASGLIRLAEWMKRTYGSSLIQALRTTMPVREKEKKKVRTTIRLLLDDDEAAARLEEYRSRHASAKARLLELLIQKKEIPRDEIPRELKITSAVIRSLEKDGTAGISSEDEDRMPGVLLEDLPEPGSEEKPRLTEEQKKVSGAILDLWESEPERPCLIEGVTGSGKTLVYMELAARVLDQGRQVIVLIPEIALSWQIVRRFTARFGRIVAVMHSRMGKSERFDQFERARRGDAKIVIGPRSALFAPFPDLGLIVIDEEQESAYQSDETPRYDARETAIRRAQIEGAHVVLGSATPSVDSFHRAKEGEYRLFTLNERYGDAVLPEVAVVDMRKELKEGNTSVLSGRLRAEMEERLKKKEQVILFLNKRGYAGFISCRSCGHVLKCPHCDVSLTAHRGGRLICHYCGYETPMVRVCPKCGSGHISGLRAGTQQVEMIVSREFPEARILRMDSDTTRGKEGHARILRSFAAHEADILIGTQMIVKGHDFPGVTLVGALLADLSLFESDYRSAERTYQLLVQAVGRAGRGKTRGLAVIQTYRPEEYCIQAAARQDYQSFYEQEIEVRSLMNYPPCASMLAVHASCRSEEKLDLAMKYLAQYLKRIGKKCAAAVIGPAPESVSKIKDYYRQVVYIKTAKESQAVRVRELLEEYIEINSGFRDIMITYDLNR